MDEFTYHGSIVSKKGGTDEHVLEKQDRHLRC